MPALGGAFHAHHAPAIGHIHNPLHNFANGDPGGLFAGLNHGGAAPVFPPLGGGVHGLLNAPINLAPVLPPAIIPVPGPGNGAVPAPGAAAVNNLPHAAPAA